jgi:uncharacterized protein (DUF305 family)
MYNHYKKEILLMKRVFAMLMTGALFLSACAGTGAEATVAIDQPSSTGAANEVAVTSDPALSATMNANETAIPGASAAATQSGKVTALPATGGEFDQMFIDMMVPHHESAVQMAQMALDKAQDPAIRQLAEQIIADQQKEIEQLRAWREQWYGSSQTPPMNQMPALTNMEGMSVVSTMDMQAEVDQLAQASNFDLAFLQAMIPHHLQAVDAAQLALKQAQHDEIRQMAQQVIDAQQQEIEQMQAMLVQLGGSLLATPTP